MTFNPTTSLLSTASGSKSLAGPLLGGPLTQKSHESHGNIIRPLPLRSRFFPAEDIVRAPRQTFKPWFEEDKENYVFGDKEKESGRTFGKMFGVFDKDSDGKLFDLEKRCLRCHDPPAFVLEPCSHTYSSHVSSNDSVCAKCMTSCINPMGNCNCIVCGQVVSNMHTTQTPATPQQQYPDVYIPTPQSLPRLGTQFTPGIGETAIMDDTKETIPFQDLSKLAKRMDWAVVKMTNVFLLLIFSLSDSLGLDCRCSL